jgi:hypothetical protein
MATALTLAIAAGGLTGCVSTQRKNARAELVADRTLAQRTPLRLHRRSRDVRVERVALVRAASGGAFVVTLRNSGAQPATDVPVAVGLRAVDGRRTQLNGGGELDWFRTHVPAIGAGATATWIFTAHRPLAAGTPYAIAGATGRAVVSHASGALPAIAARVVPEPVRGRRGAGTRGGVSVAIVNRSEIPQYDVQVYAVARDGARVLAAGAASIAHLGTHEATRVRVALVGAAGRHTVRVFALPTIFE